MPEPEPKGQWVPKADLMKILDGLSPDPDFRDDVAELGGTVDELEDPWLK